MKKDLLIVVADPAAQTMVVKLLERFPLALSVRPISWDVFVHERRDPGCYSQGVEKLNLFARDYEFCILIFDHEGCGAEHLSPTLIETQLESKLTNGLWSNRNAVIVIEPELENWIWTNSIHTSDALCWGKDLVELKDWLISKNWLVADEEKPSRPKEAMEAAMKERRKQKITSSTFESIAAKASFKSCTSPSFLKFKSTLTTWFQSPTP